MLQPVSHLLNKCLFKAKICDLYECYTKTKIQFRNYIY